MGYPTKIATCCYCGTRAALVLGRDRHELTCASCGAPLHDMKRLKQPRDRRKEEKMDARRRNPRLQASQGDYTPHYSPKRHKKKKSLVRYIVKEAFDVIEDIFD